MLLFLKSSVRLLNFSFPNLRNAIDPIDQIFLQLSDLFSFLLHFQYFLFEPSSSFYYVEVPLVHWGFWLLLFMENFLLKLVLNFLKGLELHLVLPLHLIEILHRLSFYILVSVVNLVWIRDHTFFESVVDQLWKLIVLSVQVVHLVILKLFNWFIRSTNVYLNELKHGIPLSCQWERFFWINLFKFFAVLFGHSYSALDKLVNFQLFLFPQSDWYFFDWPHFAQLIFK